MQRRIEHDLLGELEVPADAYWGIHTLRAINNFPISLVPIGHYYSQVVALGQVKQAAARANHDLGILSDEHFKAIDAACNDVIAGTLNDQFVVDAIQGGAGTSTNMNANEVIANRALEKLGYEKGDYDHLHPLNHVNASQSTNDTYPTAIKVALVIDFKGLMDDLLYLCESFEAKAHEFRDVLKMGRTQLQDAVPMTLGQEFSTYGVMIREDIERIKNMLPLISEINLGGTAIGTGLNAPEGYTELVAQHLSEITGNDFVPAGNLIEATQDTGVFITASGLLKRIAAKQSKIANDLRLLSSGPRAGFGEINLPARQAGSSIMPGKVNPVIPEVINQIAFTVIGNDLTVTMASEAGQLQLNAFEPIMSRSLMMSIAYLRRGCRVFADLCIDGITANADYLRSTVENSIGLVTALSPKIGYEKATAIAKHASEEGSTVRQAAMDLGYLSAKEFDAILGNVSELTGN